MKMICSIHNDIQLLPHYLTHYKKLGFTKFLFGIWNGEHNPVWGEIYNMRDSSIQLIPSYTEPLSEFGEVYIWNFIRETFVSQNEWYSITDLDEFHTIAGYTNVHQLQIDAISKNKHYVNSFLIDRTTIDGHIPVDIEPNPSIWEQFPYATPFTERVLNGCNHKVFIAEQPYNILAGHHWVSTSTSIDDRIVDRFSISGVCNHFKWFGKLLEREQKKATHYKKLNRPYYTENETLVNILQKNNGKLF